VRAIAAAEGIPVIGLADLTLPEEKQQGELPLVSPDLSVEDKPDEG
jgi:hypothetical protein